MTIVLLLSVAVDIVTFVVAIHVASAQFDLGGSLPVSGQRLWRCFFLLRLFRCLRFTCFVLDIDVNISHQIDGLGMPFGCVVWGCSML